MLDWEWSVENKFENLIFGVHINEVYHIFVYHISGVLKNGVTIVTS